MTDIGLRIFTVYGIDVKFTTRKVKVLDVYVTLNRMLVDFPRSMARGTVQGFGYIGLPIPPPCMCTC